MQGEALAALVVWVNSDRHRKARADGRESPGDTVLYGKYSGTEISLDNEDVLIMRESDVFAIVEKKKK